MNWLPAIAAGAEIAGDLWGAHENRKSAREAADRNEALQREFAQNGIRWRVEDAKRSGLHPLFALGANVPTASPVAVGDTSSGESFSRMGQSISRAIGATRTGQERLMATLSLDRAKLENELLRTQINSYNHGQPSNPPMPGSTNFMPSQGDSGLVIDYPLKRTVSQPTRPSQEAGWRPDVSFSRTETGFTPVIPQSLSESLESDELLGTAMWNFRNRGLPNIGLGEGPAVSQLPNGYNYWAFDRFKQEWVPMKSSTRRSFFGEVGHKFRYAR